MNKFRALFVAVALLTAACGSGTISGSQVKAVSNAGNVAVGAGANAGTDVSAGTEDAPPNPTARKQAGAVQSQPPTMNGTQSSTAGQDPCSATGANTAIGSRVAGSGPHQPLPQCPVP
jgi:hypothetical protein